MVIVGLRENSPSMSRCVLEREELYSTYLDTARNGSLNTL